MSGNSAALLAVLLLAAPAFGHDEGQAVTFGRSGSASFSVQASGRGPRVVYESGISDAIADEWDTVLIQGELPDQAVAFQLSRPSTGTAGSPSDWIPLKIHRFPGGRFWAKGRTRKAPGRLLLRAIDGGSLRSHRVDIYGVQVFAEEPVEETPPASAPRGPQNPSAPRPSLHGRDEWGAAPPTSQYSPDPVPWRITLHHSDGRLTRSLSESLDEARFIQDFHIRGRGWIDIAYHFLVDPLGNILEGRPEGALGAHTLSNNDGNVGIVLLGAYQPPQSDQPTPAQLKAVEELGRYLAARYGVDPRSLMGHRDYKQTLCPGDLVYARLDSLRQAIAGATGADGLVARDRPPFSPPTQPSWDGVLERR